MKKMYLFIVFALLNEIALPSVITITNSGFTFSPDTVTINLGDSINFAVASNHKIAEVSEATWNSNGNTPLPGFSTAPGGGLIPAALLGFGTHWYVCSPHASMGMKGVIIVKNATGINEQQYVSEITILQNPITDHLIFTLKNPVSASLNIFDCRGEIILSKKINSLNSNIDFSKYPDGIYFIQIETGNKLIKKKIIKNSWRVN